MSSCITKQWRGGDLKEKEEYILNFRQTNNQFNNTLSSIYRDEYCIYLRKSRADLEAEARGEGESLARHERILIELAKKYNLYRQDYCGCEFSKRERMIKNE